MEKALEFLKSHKDLALATVDEEGKPKLRVFQWLKFENNTFYFATDTQKEVYKQLMNNPYVEALAMEGDVSVRFAGRAYFDLPETMCKEMYDSNSILLCLYPDHKDIIYFRVPVEKMAYYDLSTNPPTQKNYLLK